MAHNGYGPTPSYSPVITAGNRHMVKQAVDTALKNVPGAFNTSGPKIPDVIKPPSLKPIKPPNPVKPFKPQSVPFTEGTNSGTTWGNTEGALAKK